MHTVETLTYEYYKHGKKASTFFVFCPIHATSLQVSEFQRGKMRGDVSFRFVRRREMCSSLLTQQSKVGGWKEKGSESRIHHEAVEEEEDGRSPHKKRREEREREMNDEAMTACSNYGRREESSGNA